MATIFVMNNENLLIQTSGVPGAPSEIEEYRIRLNAFYQSQQSLKGTGKCHVCGRKSAWYKLCPACRYFLKHPNQIAQYASVRDYTAAGIVLIFFSLLCGFLSIFFWSGAAKEAGPVVGGAFLLMVFPFFFLLAAAYGFMINQMQRWRVIHGTWPHGGQFVIWGIWIFVVPFSLGFFIRFFWALSKVH
jgi:hypothetical protein